jgi:PqqD family protein of HPr-rel-A system
LLCISRDARLTWREWEGDIVLYSDASGNTHRLEGIAAAAFEALIAGPIEREQLADHIATELEVTRDALFDSALAEALAKLLKLGLLE